jgi:hypothetical protein
MSDVIDITPVRKLDELSAAKLLRFAALDRANSLEAMVASSSLQRLVDEWIKSNPEAQKFADRLAELRTAQSKNAEAYKAVAQKVEEDLKISLSDYQLNEETLELTPAPKDAPVAAPAV